MRPSFEQTLQMLSLRQALGFPLGQLAVTLALAFLLGRGDGINVKFLVIALPLVLRTPAAKRGGPRGIGIPTGNQAQREQKTPAEVGHARTGSLTRFSRCGTKG